MTTQTEQRPFVHIPVTISSQAQEFLATLKDPALVPAFPDPADLSGWRKLQAWAEADGKAKSEPLLKRLAYTAIEGKLGGVPILDVRPKDWKDNGKALVYTHGGAHVMYSAASMLGRAVVPPIQRTFVSSPSITRSRPTPSTTRCPTRSSRRSRRSLSKARGSKTWRSTATLREVGSLPRWF